MEAANFAGRVAFEGYRQLITQDAHAIVFDCDQAHATSKQSNRDVACPSVKRVVNEFAHHRGGPLHHFTRSDLADQFIRQFADRPAHRDGWQGREGACVHQSILEG